MPAPRIDTHKLLNMLELQGWTIKPSKRRGHVLVIPPDPTQPCITLCRTPSDWRSQKNSIARLRRAGAKV